MSDIDIAWVKAEGERLRRWGKWGDGGKGALNFVTPDRIVAAASLVRDGRVVSLAMPFNSEGPQPDEGRYNPKLTMIQVGDQQGLPGGFQYADDTIYMSLQGATQWDALSHAFYDGFMWNGYPVSGSITPEGAQLNSVTTFSTGVVGRGVLLDVARHFKMDCLDDYTAISPETLDAVVAEEGVAIEIGDIVLVRTGRVGRAIREGNSYPMEGFTFAAPGLSVKCADWLVTHEIAAVAADNVAVEVTSPEGADMMMPLHMICQRDAGIPFGELFDLEALSEACAELHRWEFLLVAPPLPITGAVGSPVNPLAIF
jgi:kynurenine formamidase